MIFEKEFKETLYIIISLNFIMSNTISKFLNLVWLNLIFLVCVSDSEKIIILITLLFLFMEP